jgi:uncharacterized membrane protein YcaP (DUF421 family)
MTVFNILTNLTLGSTMSRTITQPDLNLTRGLISIFVLFGFEYITDWISSGNHSVARLFEKTPVILAFRGDRKALRIHRLTEGGIWFAMRQKGMLDLSQVCFHNHLHPFLTSPNIRILKHYTYVPVPCF